MIAEMTKNEYSVDGRNLKANEKDVIDDEVFGQVLEMDDDLDFVNGLLVTFKEQADNSFDNMKSLLYYFILEFAGN